MLVLSATGHGSARTCARNCKLLQLLQPLTIPQSQYNYPPGYRTQRKLREQAPRNLRLCASLTRDTCLTGCAGPL